MNIALTMPLKTPDGYEFAEIYLTAEVFVTHPAMPQTWNSPAEAAEFEIEWVQIEAGTWHKSRVSQKPYFISEPHPIPDYLTAEVDSFMANTTTIGEIIDQIKDSEGF